MRRRCNLRAGPFRIHLREHPTETLPDRAIPAASELEERSELTAALQQLPLMQRKTVLLRHWLDLSVREAAAELGVTEGTVKSNTARGLAALELLLERERS